MKINEEFKKRLYPLSDKLYNAIVDGNIDLLIGISETINTITKQYKEDK